MEDDDSLVPGGYEVTHHMKRQPSYCLLRQVKCLRNLKMAHPTPSAGLLHPLAARGRAG